MSPEVLELVGEDARADQCLQPHVARPHGRVTLSPKMSARVLLDHHGGRAHPEESAAVVPPSDASLQLEIGKGSCWSITNDG